VGEDVRERNRIYVPTKELKEFGISEEDVVASTYSGKVDEKWRKFMKFQIDRAEQLFVDAEAGVDLLDAKVRRREMGTL
jgi:phytoene synthase